MSAGSSAGAALLGLGGPLQLFARLRVGMRSNRLGCVVWIYSTVDGRNGPPADLPIPVGNAFFNTE